MKEKYITPIIEIETLKLSEYCASGCDATIAELTGGLLNDQMCLYDAGFDDDSGICYNGPMGISVLGS